MAHKLFIYDPKSISGPVSRPVSVREYTSIARLRCDAEVIARRAGHPFAVDSEADGALCDTIAEFASVQNIQSDLAMMDIAANCRRGRVSEDPAFWADAHNVRTPQELRAWLDRRQEKSPGWTRFDIGPDEDEDGGPGDVRL